MSEPNDIYGMLQRHLDECLPVGFPAAQSGLDLKILKRLFTPEDAELALNLGPLPETLEEIFPRVKETGMSLGEFEVKLDMMAKKSVIMGGKLIAGEKGEKRYSLSQWAIGMYEFQVDRLSKELAKDANEYMNKAFYKEWFKPGTPAQMRTVPVGGSIKVEHHVSNYDDVRNLIKNARGPFSVHNCVCKQNMRLLDRPCKLTEDERTCNTFGRMARIIIEAGLGREVTRNEMLEALEKYEEKGFVLQPENAQNPQYICACCGCCCNILQMMKKFPNPAELYTSNYFATVDSELCDGCETCFDRCQMEALTIENGISTVNLNRCIGCGLCVSTCPTNAIQLQKKEKEIAPPRDADELYQTIMAKKMAG